MEAGHRVGMGILKKYLSYPIVQKSTTLATLASAKAKS